jgi:hypothetical protein
VLKTTASTASIALGISAPDEGDDTFARPVIQLCADPDPLADRGAGAPARTGTDGRVSADRGLCDVRERMDHRAVTVAFW